MKKKVTILFILFFPLWNVLSAQKTSLSLSLYSNADTTKPLIFYISGDGGFNKFSTSFMQALNTQGYAVVGLNAKDYFWSKKKPEEAATAIETAINELNKQWKKKNIVLIGYSFGADVAPFMVTHFSTATVTKINRLILLSPSPKTDFEIHVLQMLGWGKSSGESVPAEINKISKPVTIIVGDDENEFPFSQITIKNKQLIKMPGGHHFDGDVNALCKQIVLQIK
ncbi:MAG TPA: AcvB/VirJ family lysyl-phosphatidylglycerol hydrolase [Chitinophagaceae bacterium]|jgi:type IV secretory pathway VirJ component|nr:AcvB/VirJ family lysyl-phosphatidylglycerol hydrolase [Chitinophagaceae bacterium]